MKVLIPALLAVALVACASTPTVHTDFDPQASFSAYKTYSWAVKPQAGSPLVQQRIVDGINTRLQAAGLREAPNGGDLAVAAHIATTQQQTLDTFYSGGGMGGWGWRGGWGGMGTATTTVRNYEVGTLVVDLFDARSKQAVWRGSASGTVPSSPAKVDAQVEAGLTKMFAGFPPAPGAAR